MRLPQSPCDALCASVSPFSHPTSINVAFGRRSKGKRSFSPRPFQSPPERRPHGRVPCGEDSHEPSADLKPTNCAASQPRTRVRPGRRSRAFGLPRGARHRRIARRRAEDAPGCTMRVTSCVCAKTCIFVETVGNRLATVLETVVFLWKPLETIN